MNIKKICKSAFIVLMIIMCLGLFQMNNYATSVVPSGAKQFNSHTYYIFKGKMTWTMAKAYCEKRGGHLATITSERENEFILSLMKDRDIRNCWLGGTDEAKEGSWKWITGEKFGFNDWRSGNPNDYRNIANYLGIYYYEGWDDIEKKENDIYGYVCEWDMNKTAAKSPRINVNSKKIYYKSNVTLNVLNYNKKVTWSSDNKKIATVNSSGKVVGLTLGTTTICAKVGNKKLKCKIQVIDRDSKATVSLKVKNKGAFIAKESTATINFKLKNHSCAKVNVSIVDSLGKVVYKKRYNNVSKGKTYEFAWNGKNLSGNYVSSGNYRVVVKAGNKKTYSSYISFKKQNDFLDGDGSKGNPFLISSISQFKKLLKYPNSHFKQMVNLDFEYESTGGWFTEERPFNGVYDGNNKTIIRISSTTPLFNTIGKKGQIKNLKMDKCSVVGFNTSILTEKNYGKIENCSINGTVSASSKEKIQVAVMAVENYGTVSNCKVYGIVKGTELSDFYYNPVIGGGVVSVNEESGKLLDCYSATSVSVTTGSSHSYEHIKVGGIVGINKGMVVGCEMNGTVSYVAGEEYVFNYVGGIAGHNLGQIMDSFYTGTGGISTVGKNEGLLK